MSEKRTKMNECYTCMHRREIPGDAHTNCAKPDPNMKGREHGIINGWFFYPFNFDPAWKLVDCANYQERQNP